MEENNSKSYILFGKEAVKLYKTSVKSVADAIGLTFKVEAYSEVKSFIDESKKWDDFVEISEEDYQFLKAHLQAKEPKKGFSLKNLFGRK